MLSVDLDSAAAMIRSRIPADQSSVSLSRHTLGALANAIEDCACQARELEKQIAPGSLVADNVVVLHPVEKAAQL